MDLGPWQLRAAGLLCREAPAEADAGGEGGLQGRADRALPGSAGRDLLAFAIGTHGRLGAASPVQCLAGEIGLLRMIVGWCRRWRWVGGAARREEGVMRLTDVGV